MMMKMIRANWVDLAQGCGVVAGIFLAIHLITAGVLFWGHPDSSVTISGIALPAAAGLMILVVTATYLAITFDQMVRFSLTRRRALGLLMGMAGAQALCSMGLAALLTWVERATAPMLWKAISGAASVTLERSGQVIPELGSTAAAEAVPLPAGGGYVFGMVVVSSHRPGRHCAGADYRRRDPALWRKRRLVPVGHLDGGHLR